MSTSISFNGREIALPRLNKPEIDVLATKLQRGYQSHVDALVISLPPIDRAMLLRDAVPPFVTRALLFEYTQTMPGACEAITLSLRKSPDVSAAEIPSVIDTLTFDVATEKALQVVFDLKPVPAQPSGGPAQPVPSAS